MTSMAGQGMGGDHAAALVALPFVPVAIVAVLLAAELGARAGFAPAARFRRAYLATPPAIQLAALGMIVSAAVHLALVPDHLTEEPALAVLFALDGVALVVAVAWSLTRPAPGWRTAGLLLLGGGLLAYVGRVVAGAEAPDAVGVATKVVELVAAALLVLPVKVAGHGAVIRLPERGDVTR